MEAAQPAPLLLIADDAHWLDRPTCDVLAFIARRVHFEPVVLVLAVREGIDNPFEAARLPDLVIGPLDDASAGALLDAHAPGRSPAIRGPLLQAAAGNPLALVELPVALGPDWLTRQGLYGGRMPLTARLERAFAARVRGLPLQTRNSCWIAAANDYGSLAEAIHAATLAGREPAVLGIFARGICAAGGSGRPERHCVRNAASEGCRTWPHSRRLTGLSGACEAIRSSRTALASQQPVLAAPYPGAKAFG